jgi:ribonucleotide reductase alpha subunit
VVWGVSDYFSDILEETKQVTAKIILGILGVLASFLAKNRR